MLKFGALGQAAPAAATLTALYRVPDLEAVEKARVICCNRGFDSVVRIAVAPDGAADHLKHYIAFATPLTEGETVSSVEMELGGGSLVRVWSDTGDVSFSLFGKQFTVR